MVRCVAEAAARRWVMLKGDCVLGRGPVLYYIIISHSSTTHFTYEFNNNNKKIKFNIYAFLRLLLDNQLLVNTIVAGPFIDQPLCGW